MATRAHSTRAPLLPPATLSPLLGLGFGKQPGPVTQAIRAMRASDQAVHAISAIEDGLGRFVADADRRHIYELRRAIANRIEADIALLDALAGDPDLEENGDAEPSLGAQEVSASGCYVVSYYTVNPTTSQLNWGASGADDREQDAGDDREEENEHGGNILDEPHDPQADDIQKGEHRWDPAMAGMARAARRQAEALRARMNRRGRA